jgi:hypothetical protein
VFAFIWVALAGNDRWLKGEARIVEDATVIFTGETGKNLFALLILFYCLSLNSRLRQRRVPSLQRPVQG